MPEFNTFTIERSIAAIGKQTVEFEQEIKNIEDHLQSTTMRSLTIFLFCHRTLIVKKENYYSDTKNVDIVNDLLHPLERVDVPLETTWGIANTLFYGNQSLMPQKYWESIHSRMSRARTSKFISKPIYKACKAALENPDLKLTRAQRRVTAKIALEGRLNGLDLTGKERRDYDYSDMKLFKKRQEFESKTKVCFSPLVL